MHRRTLSAAARWGFALLSVGILVVWLVSFRFGLHGAWGSADSLKEFDFYNGSLILSFGVARNAYLPPNSSLNSFDVDDLPPDRRWEQVWKPSWIQGWSVSGPCIPLYIPLALTLTPAAFLWRSHLKRRRGAARGACTGCGYDRSGLTPTTACPECGLVPKQPI